MTVLGLAIIASAGQDGASSADSPSRYSWSVTTQLSAAEDTSTALSGEG